MLSKNNKILIGCLALLLVMSVGYALFSDTITINGSATAKGEFELTTTCDTDVSDVGMEEAGSITDAKISCEGDVVNASATLGYPGSEKWFRVNVTNTGTIPAKLKHVVDLNDRENMTFSKETIDSFSGNFEKCSGDDSNMICVALFPSTDVYYDYAIGEDASMETMWFEDQFNAILEPGETAHFYISMSWLSSSTTPGDPLTASIDTELTWQQVTN